MSTLTIKSCDKCISDNYTNPDLKFFKVQVACVTENYNTFNFNDRAKHWCRNCCIITGVIPDHQLHSDEKAKKPPTPTIEEMLIELFKDLIHEEIADQVVNNN